MKLYEFESHFKDEEACKRAFKENREKVGVVCPKCGCTHHYWISKRGGMFQCKGCGYRQSLKANTIMHGSKMSYRAWFIAFHFMTATKNTKFAAQEVQRQLGLKRYQPVWEMFHKIREAMGKGDQERLLKGPVEIDEGFITTQRKEEEKGQELKRGAGSQAKAKVLVMAESLPSTPSRKGQMPRAVRMIRMLHIADLKAETIKDAALKSISTDADLVGDATSSHNLLSMFFHSYEGKVIPHEDIEKELPWVHKAIKRFRDQLNAIHIAVKRDYLQGYLDEFTWRFNHRKAGEEKFGMLMQLSAGYKNGFMHRRYAKSS